MLTDVLECSVQHPLVRDLPLYETAKTEATYIIAGVLRERTLPFQKP